MRLILPLLAALLVPGLTGCVGNAPRPSTLAVHDLGPAAGPWTYPGVPIIAVRVHPASWLASPAEQYRLAYADPLRRYAYTESHWAAPPAELIEGLLHRRIVFGQPAAGAEGCRLDLSLDEFEQHFDSPQASRAVLEVRARLLPARGDSLITRRAFNIDAPSPTADAHGGVEAARAAVDALTVQLSQWLGEVARSQPRSIAPCKEKS